jgi:transposase-like protein
LRRSFEERLKAVKLQLEEGFTQALVAQEMGVSLAAIGKWVALYRRHGEEGLKSKPRVRADRAWLNRSATKSKRCQSMIM